MRTTSRTTCKWPIPQQAPTITSRVLALAALACISPFKSAAQNFQKGQRTDFKAMNPELPMISQKIPKVCLFLSKNGQQNPAINCYKIRTAEKVTVAWSFFRCCGRATTSKVDLWAKGMDEQTKKLVQLKMFNFQDEKQLGSFCFFNS